MSIFIYVSAIFNHKRSEVNREEIEEMERQEWKLLKNKTVDLEDNIFV